MAADTPIGRLLGRIEQTIGLDLCQRERELERWLATCVGASEPAAIAAFGERLSRPGSPELVELVHRFAVSHTRFFRDAGQLAVVDSLLTALPRPRLWVAGCATGEEAYSVALLAQSRGRRVEIVASDINTGALNVARSGRYPREVLSSIDPQYQEAFHIRDDHVTVRPSVARVIQFVEHNLLSPPLLPAGAEYWDLILCRNVLIYFRPALATAILGRLGSVLAPGGYLLAGASEFHLTSPGLVPRRLAERMVLQRAPAAAPAAGPPPREPPLPLASSAEAFSQSRLAPGLLLGRLDVVLGEALAALVGDPELQPALFLAGVAHHLKGNHREATALLARTLLQHPTCWPATFFLASSHEALGETRAARAAYITLREELPPTPEAQRLIELLGLQQWRPEALALAARRLAAYSE